MSAFAKLRKTIISYIVSVRLSVSLHGTIPLPVEGFSFNLILEYFFKNLSRK